MMPRELADQLLSDIAAKKAEIDKLSAQMEAERVVIADRYKMPIAQAIGSLAGLEVDLEVLVKQNREELLHGKDRAEFLHGSVMLKIEKRVKRIRTMLNKLKAAAMKSAIKVAESVDWDVVDKFDDATLKKLGTKRVPKDIFSYEIKG